MIDSSFARIECTYVIIHIHQDLLNNNSWYEVFQADTIEELRENSDIYEPILTQLIEGGTGSQFNTEEDWYYRAF